MVRQLAPQMLKIINVSYKVRESRGSRPQRVVNVKLTCVVRVFELVDTVKFVNVTYLKRCGVLASQMLSGNAIPVCACVCMSIYYILSLVFDSKKCSS